MKADLKTYFGRLAPKVIRAGALVTRPLTLGVRGVVIDARDGVFLVRHGYTPGWHLPGGGVEAGESARTALEREILEETGLRVTEAPVLHGIFQHWRRDHVLVYVVRAFVHDHARRPDWEIAEGRFFDQAALPDETTAATRRRLRETLQDAPPTLGW